MKLWQKIGLLFLLPLMQCTKVSSTAELFPKGRTRYAFNISIQPSNTPKTEEYLCAVQRVDVSEETTVYLDDFVYFVGHENVHHSLLYGCNSVSQFALDNQYWSCNARGKGNLCSGRKQIPLGIPQNYSRRDPRNQKAFKLPEKVGYAIGPKFNINYLMLELHFLPQLRTNDQDNNGTKEISGIIAHGTIFKPKYLAGMLTAVAVGFSIPPGHKKYSVDVNCKPGISEPIFPYAAWVHTHDLGVVVSGYKVNKANKEFTEMVKWSRWLPQPVIFNDSMSKLAIFPGDYIAAKCTFDSSNTTAYTRWGPHKVGEEMCNLFLFFYTSATSNGNDVSFSCVNEMSKDISNHFPPDADTLRLSSDNLSNDSSNLSICSLYNAFSIKNCPFS